MRSILLFCIAVLLSLPSWCQSSTCWLVSYTEKDIEGTRIHSEYYIRNKSAQLVAWSVEQNDYTVFYEMKWDGESPSEYNEALVKGSPVGSHKMRYQNSMVTEVENFDDQGNSLGQRTYIYDEEKGVVAQCSEWTQDEEGNSFSKTQEFSWSDDGKQLTLTETEGDVMIQRTEVTYDDHPDPRAKLRVPELFSSHNVLKWMVYDEKGDPITDECYVQTFEYDEAGLPVKGSRKSLDGALIATFVFRYKCG